MRRRSSFTLLAALSAASCGSVEAEAEAEATPAPTCEDFQACGGDVVGSWTVSQVCPSQQLLAELSDELKLCDEATVTVEPSLAGTLQFEEGGLLLRNFASALEVKQTVPSSCLPGVSCAALRDGIASDVSTTGVVCASTLAGCSCSLRMAGRELTQETYSSEGNQLLFTAADGELSRAEYCVSGSWLIVADEDGTFVLERRAPR